MKNHIINISPQIPYPENALGQKISGMFKV